MSAPTIPYRPSNGTEGDIFMDAFCYRCRKDDPDAGVFCPIRDATVIFDIDDAEYPKEWVKDAAGDPYAGTARCTAFEEKAQ